MICGLIFDKCLTCIHNTLNCNVRQHGILQPTIFGLLIFRAPVIIAFHEIRLSLAVIIAMWRIYRNVKKV